MFGWHGVFVVCALTVLTSSVLCATPNFTIARCPEPVPKPSSDLWNKMQSTFSTPFVLASGTGYPIEPTIVYSCYTDDHVYFKMLTEDDSIQTNFTGCNQPIYTYVAPLSSLFPISTPSLISDADHHPDLHFRMDALEAFFSMVAFAPHSSDPHHYIELEVSPYAGFFYANIYNPLLTCKNMTGDLQPCTGSGITVFAGHNPPNWWAYLKIPWKLLGAPGGAKQMQATPYVWKGNFFRVDLLPFGRQFSCWSPTYTNPACFHRPKYFGNLILEF